MAHDALRIDPRLPEGWESLSFRLVWQGQPLKVYADKTDVRVENLGSRPVKVTVCGVERSISCRSLAGD